MKPTTPGLAVRITYQYTLALGQIDSYRVRAQFATLIIFDDTYIINRGGDYTLLIEM